MSALAPDGADLIVKTVRAAVASIVLFEADRQLVVLNAPGFTRNAQASGIPSRYEVRDRAGAILFGGRAGEDVRITTHFVEAGAEVRLTDLEVIVEGTT